MLKGASAVVQIVVTRSGSVNNATLLLKRRFGNPENLFVGFKDG